MLSTSTRLRVAIGVFVLLVNAVHGSSLSVLPWALLVIGADLAIGAALTTTLLGQREQRILAWAFTAFSTAAAGLALTSGAGGVPLVVIPLLRAGEVWGRTGVLGTLGVFVPPAVIAWAVTVGMVPDLGLPSLGVWLALTVTLAAAAVWAKYLTPEPDPGDARAAEAAWLLNRLECLADELRSGFDPATSAEHLLDALPRRGDGCRSALLVGAPTDAAVPLALRGSPRVPWSDPRRDTGVLGQAWRRGATGMTSSSGGRFLVAIPLRDSADRQIGVLVTDGLLADVSPQAYLAAVTTVVRQHQGLVAVALSFSALRERAGIEERERLARVIHDGVAQELVALGFRIDRMKRLPAEDLRAEAAVLRTDVSRIVADVRSRIGDLRRTVRPEGGLGAAVTSQLQAFGAATGAAVTLRLAESPFRLPAHVETGLYRVVLDFLADARRNQAREVELSVSTQAPLATVRMYQSEATGVSVPEVAAHLPESVLADVHVTASPAGSEIVVHLTAVSRRAAVL